MSFRKATFTKTEDGGWRFTWGNHVFKAWRNEAGFAHRDWELHNLDRMIVIEDMLPSRQACVDAAAAWAGNS